MILAGAMWEHDKNDASFLAVAMVFPIFPPPMSDATPLCRRVRAGMFRKGVKGWGVWGEGKGGKRVIAEVRITLDECWLSGEGFELNPYVF